MPSWKKEKGKLMPAETTLLSIKDNQIHNLEQITTTKKWNSIRIDARKI